MKLNQKGSYYIEVLIALTLLSILGSSILPIYSRFPSDVRKLSTRYKLHVMSVYVSNYIFRWAGFTPESKPVPFEFYQDGFELELSGEKRINRLLWAAPLLTETDFISDAYKTSIQFFETDRNNSAVVKVVVWEDRNLDNIINENEEQFNYSMIVTEKMNQ